MLCCAGKESAHDSLVSPSAIVLSSGMAQRLIEPRVTLRDFSSLTSWYAQPALWVDHTLDLAQINIPDELFILLVKPVKKIH